MDLDSRYFLQAGVKFRYEEFGGVVYRRQDDRLHFIKSVLTVDLLSLAGTGTVREIAAKVGAGSSNQQVIQENVLKLLSYLEGLEIVYELEH